MFSISGIFAAAIIAGSLLVSNVAATTQPRPSKIVSPFVAQLIEYKTPLPYSTVIERLDAQVNKTGALTFVAQFRAAKTKEQQTSLIADITQGRSFLYFSEANHQKWLDIYFPDISHPGGTIYTLGNPNFASQIIPLDYSTSINIPLRFMILEQADRSGTRIMYHQPSSIFAPFNKRGHQLQTYVKSLDTQFAALFESIIDY